MRVFNKTAPQQLNAQTLPPEFNVAAGHQLPGSLVVPLASFPPGDYRLEITVTDKASGKTVKQNANFRRVGIARARAGARAKPSDDGPNPPLVWCRSRGVRDGLSCIRAAGDHSAGGGHARGRSSSAIFAVSSRTTGANPLPAPSSRRSDRPRHLPFPIAAAGSRSAISCWTISRSRAPSGIRPLARAHRSGDPRQPVRQRLRCHVVPTRLLLRRWSQRESLRSTRSSVPTTITRTTRSRGGCVHAKRSVLKEADQTIADLGRHDSFFGDSIGGLGHAVGTSARFASSLFDDLSMNGQFHLLTTTSFDRPQDLFSMNVALPKSVAFLSLEAPGAQGDWTMRGTMTQGDSRRGFWPAPTPACHRSMPTKPVCHAACNATWVATATRWPRCATAAGTLAPCTVRQLADRASGAGQLRGQIRALRLPDGPRLVESACEHCGATDAAGQPDAARVDVAAPGAPGAEGSCRLRSASGYLERTFAPVARGCSGPSVTTRWKSALSAHGRVPSSLASVCSTSASRTSWSPCSEWALPTDVPTASGIGHYEVGSAGGYDARGWGVTVSRAVNDRLRATVDYAQADAVWHRRSPDFDALAALERSVLQLEDRVHDLTASVESVVAPTSTRLFVRYQLNAAFAAADAIPALATARTRADVQVNQALPFLNFTNASWRCSWRSRISSEELGETSIYDEALVVRPPKRVLGGVTVKF